MNNETNQHTRVGTFCEKCRQIICVCKPNKIMSKEMTADEYLEGQYGTTDVTGPVLITTVIAARHYGDLRAKEAVKEFAEELMLYKKQYRTLFDERILTMAVRVDYIKRLAKQKGVEI